jgi:hypothetical protein
MGRYPSTRLAFSVRTVARPAVPAPITTTGTPHHGRLAIPCITRWRTAGDQRHGKSPRQH